jgi:acetyl esterase/lipase
MDMRIRRIATWLTVLMVGIVAPVLFAGQAVSGKKPLTYDAYDSWRSIRGTVLSRDGAWLVYALVPQDGDGELVARDLRSGAEHRAPRGKDPVITADGKFVVFAVAPLKADVDKAKKDKKKPEEMPKAGFGIIDLATGAVKTFERVKSFKVAEDGGAFVAWLAEAPEKKPDEKKDGEKPEEKAADGKKKEKKKEPGTDLVVRELATGKDVTIAEVSEYAWNKPGTWLAYAVSSKTPEKEGAFARRAADGVTRALLAGKGSYKGFAFDEKGDRLAFLSDRDDAKAEAPVFKLYLWESASAAAAELIPAGFRNMPAGMAVSEHGTLSFAKDGARLFFGLAPVPVVEPEDAPEPIKVDIWNWKDSLLQPMQKARAEEEKKRSYAAVVHLAGGGKKTAARFVPLGGPDLPEIVLSDDAGSALGATDLPYRMLASWDRDYSDYYLVNVVDGARKKVVAKSPWAPSFSPGARFLVYFGDADKNYYAYRIADGKLFNLTAALGVRLTDEDWDEPGEPEPYGLAGWTEGDRSVLIYDRYDIWEVCPDGSGARMITAGVGRKSRLVFRYDKLDPEEKAVPLGRPLFLKATDDVSKASGIYRIVLTADAKPGAPAPSVPEKVFMLERQVGDLLKAKSADVFVFTLQRFDEFPDLWASGPGLTDMTRVSDANPQQATYLWGRAELIDYVDADGRPLRATLIKPEDFDPSKTYPLMVYIYEKLTSGLHRYVPPAPGTSINVSRYVSNGYLILMPDIVYETGYPGECALKCVVPAVQEVLRRGFIDPKRIGIQGHSWGGYQISYLVTRTDIFAAVEAGASVVDMTSAYGGIRWGTGMSRAWQYEKAQSRIGGTPWTRSLQFIENSPIFWVEKVKTPYLTIHNDEDDAVPWYQGIEFFTALRRLGKEAYLFDFVGEKHGLRERPNQKYWTVHLDEFFDHFLKGAPRPEWMNKGVPYLERGKRDIDALFRKGPGR